MSGHQTRLKSEKVSAGVLVDAAMRQEREHSEHDFLIQLGGQVRELRMTRDMSRRELARRSGISERYIAQIESGRGNVSIMLLLRIAQAVRCA